MSVVFVQIKMIETQVPQLVSQASGSHKDTVKVSISLEIQDKDLKLIVNDNGKNKEVRIVGKESYDLEKLYQEAKIIKSQYPFVFKIELKPSSKVSLNQIVSVMDKIRKAEAKDGKFSFKDAQTGQDIQTDLIFPDIVFASGV
jgi:biopolymer transport protein ExbD